MALTVDEIAEILNTMRVENEHNVENFQKVLTGINNKIELIAEDNEATDLIKLYISELKKIVEDRHNDANSRFSGIENSLNNILSSQNNGAKTSEIVDLSKVVSASFNAMSDEFSHQENALNELDSKLDLIKTNSFNKDELAGLLSSFASDLSQMNSDVEKSFGKIENSLTEALEKINGLDFSSQISSIDSKIVALTENIDAIPSKISFASLEDKISYFQNIIETLRRVIVDVPTLSAQAVSKQFSDLENSFENILSEEDFNAFKDNLFDYIRQLNDSTVIVSAGINENKEKIENILNVINSLDYKNNLSEISDKIQELADTVKGSSQANTYEIQNIDSLIGENISSLEEKLSVLLNTVEGMKDTNLNDFSEDFKDKVSELKQELELINTDISGALQAKSDDVMSAIESVKAAIDGFSVGSDFDKFLEDIKSELETSFMNFSVDVNGELSAHSESVLRLEQAFKETYNKVTVIEDCVSEDIKNSIELLNITIETNTRNLKCGLEEKLDEYINDLKAHLDLVINDTKTLDSIDSLKDELSVKLDAVISEQENLAQQNNVLSSSITNLGDDLKNYVKSACENTIDKYSPIQHKEAVDLLNQKVDSLVESTSDEEIIDILDQLEQKTEKIGVDLSGAVNSIKDKIDLIENDNSVNTELKALSEKIDIIASDASVEELQEKFDEFSSKVGSFTENDSLENAIKALSAKIDIIATDTSVEELHEKFDDFSVEEDKISEMLATLHEKVDAIALDGADFDIEEEIDDIKSLIFEQRKYFEASSDEKAAAIDKYLRDVLMKLDNVDLEKNSEDIKDSIINTLVSLFEQISFVEESEDIKDFVEEKTEQINQNLIEVQNQLKQITNPSDDFDYSYTLQDVETDIAKLRMAINNISDSNFENISDDIKKIVSSVEGLESTLTQEQIVDLKGDIEKLNEDILSISSRTNKLLLTSDESYKALNDGLNNFSSLVYKLEDRINYLDNSEVSERLERKIDNIQSMAVASANADKVFHQVMMYLGEWIDSTTENITSITEKTSEISKIKKNLEELKDAIPEKSDILDEIENKFEEQESRIDRLEMKLEKILSTLEEKDNMMLNRKVDKIEKMLSRLGTNIEKLASYVDEE